ncbi:MAG: hypothetical protein COB07_05150 [Sulfurovum sp.]|nr:MAG: hypothetical protein COB07_05150 [Sulfurovum sp.]
MIEFQDVMSRVKEILLKENKKEKIRDRDIADSLDLDPQYFAVIKRRKKIPYEHLAYFCKKHYISLNWILLEQKPQHLKTIS